MFRNVVDLGLELKSVGMVVEAVEMSKEPASRCAWQQLHRQRNDSHPGRVDGDSSLRGYHLNRWERVYEEKCVRNVLTPGQQ